MLALLPVHWKLDTADPTLFWRSVMMLTSTPGRRKSRRLCHINMLKHYHQRDDTVEKPVALATTVEQEEVREPDTNEEDRCVIMLSNSDVLKNLNKKLGHLPDPEKTQIKSLLYEFTAIFPDAPGITTAAVHDVDMGDAVPIKQHPYHVNPAKREYMRKKVAYML